jgi:hypothetical protein
MKNVGDGLTDAELVTFVLGARASGFRHEESAFRFCCAALE